MAPPIESRPRTRPEQCATGSPRDWSPSQYPAIAGERSPDLLALVGPDGTVRFESRAIERVLGYAHGEQLGVPIWDFVHPDDLVSAAGAFNETNRKLGYHHPVEFRVRTRDGGWVRCEVSGTSLEGPGGQWLVLSLRPTRDRSEVMARRQRIESLIRTASVECSTVHWRAADRLVGEFLGELADVVGAVRAELAWEVGGNGLVLAARWPDELPCATAGSCHDEPALPFEPIWRLEELASTLLGFSSEPAELPPSAARDEVLEHGAHAAVEVPLSSGPPWAVLRLTLGERWWNWDDVNLDLVSVLATILTSTLRRCRAEAHLRHQARTDALTGLLNRAELYRRFERLLKDRESGERRGDATHIGVLYADLDDFKSVNDHFGHAAGDRLLVAVADALRGAVRDVDLVARIGGDEFVVVCPDLESPEQLGRVEARVVQAVGSLRAGGGSVRLSVGSALAEPGATVEDALRLADEAMYRLKRSR